VDGVWAGATVDAVVDAVTGAPVDGVAFGASDEHPA
jgi:hypothetical protein